MLSKAELARRAGLSALTIDRVEAGRPCRLDTKRRILSALGLEVGDHPSVFGSSPKAFSEMRSPETQESGLAPFRSLPGTDEIGDPRGSV